MLRSPWVPPTHFLVQAEQGLPLSVAFMVRPETFKDASTRAKSKGHSTKPPSLQMHCSLKQAAVATCFGWQFLGNCKERKAGSRGTEKIQRLTFKSLPVLVGRRSIRNYKIVVLFYRYLVQFCAEREKGNCWVLFLLCENLKVMLIVEPTVCIT